VVASGRFVGKVTGVGAIGEFVPGTVTGVGAIGEFVLGAGPACARLTRDDVRTKTEINNTQRFIFFPCDSDRSGSDTGFIYLAATRACRDDRNTRNKHPKALKGLGSKAIARLGI
jgi:hypothetical protein